MREVTFGYDWSIRASSHLQSSPLFAHADPSQEVAIRIVTNGDGTLGERRYYSQNLRGDVSAIVTSGGALSECVKYSPYGIPFRLTAGDTEGDGICDATDAAQIAAWYGSTPPMYDVRGDFDLDGDTTDKTAAEAPGAVALGWRVRSSTSVSNRRGYAGYEIGEAGSNLWHVRNRALDSLIDRWLQRDPLGYVDSLSLPEYAKVSPIRPIDPLGLIIPWAGSRTFSEEVSMRLSKPKPIEAVPLNSQT